jgi:predicted dehydrogenase
MSFHPENHPGVAFIGLGIMGHRMLSSMTAHGGFRIVCAWDPSNKARDEVAKLYPDVRIADNAADAIGDADAEITYIACPPAAHRQYALMAAERGKIVYCEKPLGVDVEDSRHLVDAFTDKSITNAVNFPFADAAAVNLMSKELKSGAIGEVTGVDVRLHFASWPRGWQQAAPWLSQREQGGFVREVASHYVYLAEKLFGRAELINSTVTYPEDGISCETHFLAQLDCSGIPVSFAGGSGGVGPDIVQFTIWGSKKSYRLWDWNQIYSSTGGEWQRQLTHIADARHDGYMRMLDNFKRQVSGDPHTMASFGDALSVQIIVEDILAH